MEPTELIQQIFGLFGGSEGKAAAVLAWFVTATTLAKIFSGYIQAFLLRALGAVVDTTDTDDDAIAARILRHPAYRALAWLADVTTRVKFPLKLPEKKTEGQPNATVSILLALLLPAVIVVCSGCAGWTVAEGADPVVVHAEHTAETALDTFEDFLKFEFNHRPALLQLDPKIKEIADDIRRNAPQWIEDLRVATQSYKHNRSPENKATLATAQAVISTALQRSQLRMAQAKKGRQ